MVGIRSHRSHLVKANNKANMYVNPWTVKYVEAYALKFNSSHLSDGSISGVYFLLTLLKSFLNMESDFVLFISQEENPTYFFFKQEITSNTENFAFL